MGKQITINDPLRLLPPNPDQWPDDLKAAIRKCCCDQATSSPPPTVVTFPFDCCQGTGVLPSNFSVGISGTLTHDGTYPMKPWPLGQLPDWYPAEAPHPPSGLLCGISLGAIGTYKFISDLYEDFSVVGVCTNPAIGCPGVVTTTVTFDFFYFLIYDSCGIDLVQIYRTTETISYPGSGQVGNDGLGPTPAGPCSAYSNTTVQWWPTPNFGTGCNGFNLMSTRGSQCTKITCNPPSFLATLQSPLPYSPWLGVLTSATTYCLGGYPTLNGVYEPRGVCQAGQPTGATARIIL